MLLAATTSSPEFFATLADTFYYHNSVGLGAVLGGCGFDLLLILGCCALATTVFSRTPKPLTLLRTPLLRDAFFIAVVFGWVFFGLRDGMFECYEASVMVLWYLIYVGTVWNMTRESSGGKKSEMADMGREYTSQRASMRRILNVAPTVRFVIDDHHYTKSGDFSSVIREDYFSTHTPEEMEVGSLEPRASQSISVEDSRVSGAAIVGGATEATPILPSPEGHVTKGCCHVMLKVFEFLKLPWNVLFSWTIPDCRTHKWHNWWVVNRKPFPRSSPDYWTFFHTVFFFFLPLVVLCYPIECSGTFQRCFCR